MILAVAAAAVILPATAGGLLGGSPIHIPSVPVTTQAPAFSGVVPNKPATTTPAPVSATPTVAPAPVSAAPASPPPVVTMYDSAQAGSLPAGSGFDAVYANGAYQANPASIPGHPNLVWIDTNGSDPHANALDIEPGDASPDQAAGWVSVNTNSTVILYTFKADWPAVQASVATLSPANQARVRYWIADPTGQPHLLPGSAATQYSFGGNMDTSLVNGDFASNS